MNDLFQKKEYEGLWECRVTRMGRETQRTKLVTGVPATADLTYTCIRSGDKCNLLPDEHFRGGHVMHGETVKSGSAWGYLQHIGLPYPAIVQAHFQNM